MNIRTGVLLLTGLALGVSACHKDKEYNVGEQVESCSVSFALRPDYTVDEVVLTRAVERPADADFSVRLENTRAEVLRTWKYAELPDMIKVVPGSYKLVAYYGSDTVLPAFDTPYYYGETKVTLKDGDNLDTVVRTSVGTVKVALDFDKSFGFDYDDYFVDVKTVGDSLRFLKTETREGYFLPGNLRMRFGLRPRGQEAYYEFYPPAIKNVGAKEFYRMTLKAQSENGALSKISIETDSTTIDIPVDVELPFFFLPKAAPKVTFSADGQEGGSVATTEGVSKRARVKISAAAGLTELKIKTVSDTLLARGWPAEFDLMKATEEQKKVLKSNGLVWSENVDKQDTIKSAVWLLFDDVVKLLSTAPQKTAVSAFEVFAKDRFAQEGDGRFDVKVAPPVFEFVNEPGEGNVWAKRALYDVKYVSERETPVVECRGADGQWKALETMLTEKNTDEYECLAKGLTPATDYDFRVRLGGHTLDAGSYVTEVDAQVPNAGMEEWYSEDGKIWSSVGKKGPYWYFWYPWNPDDVLTQGWNTINLKTTNIDWKYQYNSISGTMRTDDKHSGNYAALIRTVGWGSGNTAAGDISEVKNIDPGYLYLGSYDSTNKSPEFNYKFASRPSSLQFYYKYSSKDDRFSAEIVIQNRNGDVITELGRGSFAGVNVGSYTFCKVPVSYNEEYARLRATHMYILFKSGDKTDKNSLLELPPFANLGDGKCVGSQLYIDDIELIYE